MEMSSVTETLSGFGLTANYDLGGGAIMRFGVDSSKARADGIEEDPDDSNRSLGLAFSCQARQQYRRGKARCDTPERHNRVVGDAFNGQGGMATLMGHTKPGLTHQKRTICKGGQDSHRPNVTETTVRKKESSGAIS